MSYVLIRLLFIAHIAAAMSVTRHALLHKRNVSAAIGWIGLAWLSPVLGCVFYWLFGINRVTRRALRLKRNTGALLRQGGQSSVATLSCVPDHIAVIAKVGQRVTGSPLAEGNAVLMLNGGDEAYPAMLTAIESAQRSIALASYIFRNDSAGCAFVDHLSAARARGVDVRVLLDGIGSGYVSSSAVRYLRKRGLVVERFLHAWLPWRMPLLNMRNHKKLLIVDGSIGFTGGINIGAENVLAFKPVSPVRDVHFRVQGPVVGHLMSAFCLDWEFTTGEALAGTAWHPTIPSAGSAFARGISQGPDEDLDKLESILLTAIGQAQSRIRIVTPYFLPDERLSSALSLAAIRGVTVDIVLPERSNWLIVDWATRAHLSDLTMSGCKLFLSAGPFDHTKLMTVDGLWCLVGSANWDERSLRLNFEFNLEIYDAALIDGIDRLIDQKLAQSTVLSCKALVSRSPWLKLRDAAARLLFPYL